MGACGSSEADDAGPAYRGPVGSGHTAKATTEVDAQPAAPAPPPQKKFCGTPGYDENQRVHFSAVFFADFDQTFAKSHTFKTSLNMGEEGLKTCDMEVIEEWFGGADRVQALKQFLQKLVGCGVSTVIVTYGLPKLVKILLDRTGFLDSRYAVKGIFGCVRPGILYNKGQALISIYNSMTDTAFEDHRAEILFADDSKSNIDAVSRECELPDNQNILVDKNTAMTEEHMDTIAEFFAAVAAEAGGGAGSAGGGGYDASGDASGRVVSTTRRPSESSEDPGVPIVQQTSDSLQSPRRGSGRRVKKLTLV